MLFKKSPMFLTVSYTHLKGREFMPTITEKIISAHLIEGEMKRGEPIAIHIDQTLTPVSYTHLDVYKRQLV